MKPEQVDPVMMRAALQEIRSRSEDLDDETIACIVDGGLRTLPAASRSRALLAIANNPEVAAIVAELHDPASRVETLPIRGMLGWRLACAACTLLATGASLWTWSADRGTASPELLDGSGGLPATVTGSHAVPMVVLVGLWLLAAATALPGFVRPVMHRATWARGRESMD